MLSSTVLAPWFCQDDLRLQMSSMDAEASVSAMSQMRDVSMAPRIGRPPKYDWETLCDGSVWKAIQGRDFDTTPKNYRTLLRYQARKRDQPVEVHIRGNVVWFRFSRADLEGVVVDR